jgi:spoIIIJ-associated protein
MFGIFGFTFPAGLVVYWTTSNLWQIGQQAALLRAGHIGPDALERRRQEIANKPAKTGGMFSGMIARAEAERKRKSASSGTPPASSRGSQAKGTPRGGFRLEAVGLQGRQRIHGPATVGRVPRAAAAARAAGRGRRRSGRAPRSREEAPPMARDTEARGPSVEDAVEVALAELGATEQEVRIEVLQEPKAGFLGVGGQEAVVRVRVTREELDMDALEEQADLAADFVEDLLAKMGIDATAEPNVVNDHMYVDILGDDEDDMALLIGRHGATLEALQELTRMVVGRRLDERCRVIIDVEDYRKRREEKMIDRALQVARRVLETGQEEALDP